MRSSYLSMRVHPFSYWMKSCRSTLFSFLSLFSRDDLDVDTPFNKWLMQAMLILYCEDKSKAKALAESNEQDQWRIANEVLEAAFRANDLEARRLRVPRGIVWVAGGAPGGGMFVSSNPEGDRKGFLVETAGVLPAYEKALLFRRSKRGYTGKEAQVKFISNKKRHSTFYGVFWDYKRQAWFCRWKRIADGKTVTRQFYLTRAEDDSDCVRDAQDTRWRAEVQGECHPKNLNTCS